MSFKTTLLPDFKLLKLSETKWKSKRLASFSEILKLSTKYLMMTSFSSLKPGSKLIWLEGIEKLFVSKSTLAERGLRTNAPKPGTTTVSLTNNKSDMASAMEIILIY